MYLVCEAEWVRMIGINSRGNIHSRRGVQMIGWEVFMIGQMKRLGARGKGCRCGEREMLQRLTTS